MKQFQSIEKIDTAILYTLELASSLSVLLLAFGLIASMANVLTKGSVLSDNLIMQRVWAWTQCIAIDASVAGTIIRTFRYHAEGERVKMWLHGLLSVLLLFTAAIVSNIESVQQTLNVTLDAAYLHVFVPVEVLIWVRSVVIVLLMMAHALRHAQHQRSQPDAAAIQAATPPAITPELVNALRAALAPVTVTEETLSPQALAEPQGKRQTSEHEHRANTATQDGEQGANAATQGENNEERIRAYLAAHPEASDRDIATALTISTSTANKWRKRIYEAEIQGERSA